MDISANPVKKLAPGLGSLEHLEELWASYCLIDDFNDVETALGDKEELTTVYFEGTPLQLRQPALYRNKVRLALPRVKQIDASKSFRPELT
jgi:protein phosphatase 1 regulatory subunit 7